MDRFCTECGEKIDDSMDVMLTKTDHTGDLCKECWDNEWEKIKKKYTIKDKGLSKMAQEKEYVAILECSAGNDTVGDMWLETLICKSNTTVEELIEWKKEKYSKGKLIITEADTEIKKKKGYTF